LNKLLDGLNRASSPNDPRLEKQILSRCWKQLLAASLTKTEKLASRLAKISCFGIAGSANWNLTLAGNAVKKKQNRNGIIDATCSFATG